LANEQAENILTQEYLRNLQTQLSDHEQVINELSALVSHKETEVVELRGELEARGEEVRTLLRENKAAMKRVEELQGYEGRNGELMGQVQWLEKEVARYRLEVARQVDSDVDAKKSVGKEKEISIFLSKNNDQLKREISKLLEEKEGLQRNVKRVE
jgi:chromosome segregation ATPase